jgi:hypothetical protein
VRAEAPLEQRQAALVAALVSDAPACVGIDPTRTAALARILLTKRRKRIVCACPQLRGLIHEAPTQFAEYARLHPVDSDADARVDAARYLRWLRRRGALPAGRDMRRLAARMLAASAGFAIARTSRAVFRWLRARASMTSVGAQGASRIGTSRADCGPHARNHGDA